MLGVVVESVLLVVVEELEEFLHHYGEDTPECPPCGEGGEREGSISSILGVRVGDSS